MALPGVVSAAPALSNAASKGKSPVVCEWCTVSNPGDKRFATVRIPHVLYDIVCREHATEFWKAVCAEAGKCCRHRRLIDLAVEQDHLEQEQEDDRLAAQDYFYIDRYPPCPVGKSPA